MRFDIETTPWREFPDGIRADGQLIAIPDIHGRSDLLEQALNHIARLPVPAGDIARNLVFLGDLIDRGPDSFGAIRMAMDAQLGDTPAIILPGNHEGMLLDGVDFPIEYDCFRFWYKCGGNAVIDQLPCGGRGTQAELREKLIAALPEGYLDLLRGGGPTHHRSGDLLLVHAGIPPFGLDLTRAPMGNVPATLEAFLAQPLADAPRLHWAWLREPFLSWAGGWDADRRIVVVHGHSIECKDPYEDQDQLLQVIDRVGERRRIGLDIGAGFFDRLVLLEAIETRYRFHWIQGKRYLD